MFINVLQEYLKKHKMSNMVAFVDPAIIGAIGCGTVGDRSRALSIRFKNAQPGQIFLLPYNSANHWTLTAVNPDSQMVYHMDPLKRRIAAEEWIEVVDNAIKLYKDKAKKFLKKKIMWENLAGVPLQNGSKDCGLFVMGYMKEICEDKELKFPEKWLRRSNHAYGITELNAIRIKWAKYFMKKHST
ncbi:putative Ulp1 protease family catalytic domain-containing protein [Heracleum sosnowskyi]|uniref:Ulp1 protease family catalytic domain-containing protein n=1 Tax=Heracleum sosnowskyi TaxID=360622 RepID=A0AAD8IA37_9APIA|nr:putative Ulp1 protease family catalytic domain-containing protein [Heracleum sosnowskyi]